MKVLIGCERSGVIRRAFRVRGHDAWSCDLVPADDGSKYHLQCDVLTILNQGWDLAIFHPDCTYLTNSAVCWLWNTPKKPKPGVLYESPRWKALDAACEFFRKLLDAPIPKLTCENPIPHKYAVERLGRNYDQLIQPYQFGHAERKATCLWLKNLPLLKPTSLVALPKKKSEAQRIHYLSPSSDRARQRSVSFQGIGNAMAEQWGSIEPERET